MAGIKRPDLSTRNVPVHHSPIPSFSPREYTLGAVSNSGITDIFGPATACTVQWITLQVLTACTLQLLVNRQPNGVPFSLPANTILRLPGLLLVNNMLLSLSLSNAATVNFEIAWTKTLDAALIINEMYVSSGAQSGRKQTTIETTTPLAGGGSFTGAWHDSDSTGETYVTAYAFANVIGSAWTIEESDDNTNVNFPRVIATWSGAISASTLSFMTATIRARFWRVRFTNGAGAQASFEITTSSTNTALLDISTNSLSGGGLPQGLATRIYLPGGATILPIEDTFNLVQLSPINAAGSGPMDTAARYYGGRFVGTASATKQGFNYARTSTVFKQVSTAATGSTALWTPGAGNKFRVLGYRIQVTALATAAAGADLKISLLDAAADLGLSSFVTIPVAAGTTGLLYDSGWIDVGYYGLPSAAINNVLNLNLSFALTGGQVNCCVSGNED